MNINKIDIDKMEEQRYEDIIQRGKYIEVKLLIDSEEKNEKIPIITTCAHDCKPLDIGCMYLALKALTEQFKKTYPAECLASELTMNTEHLGSSRKTYKTDDTKKED